MCNGIFEFDGAPIRQVSPEPEEEGALDRKNDRSQTLPWAAWEAAEEDDWESLGDSGPQIDAGREYEDLMSFEAIAEAMGITPQVVRTTYRRAIEKIRKRPQALRTFQLLVEYRRALREREALRKNG